MKAAHAVRGAALPETALVLTATLAMVFGIIQIGIIGFLQIMVDGAAFVAAHEYALGDSNYAAVTKRPFPLVNSNQIFIDQNNPDTTSVPVNYNTSATNARYGGVSLIRGSHLQATVTHSAPGGLLGVGIAALSSLAVHGSAIEPDNMVSNEAYDVGGNGYGSSSNPTQYNFYNDMQNAGANYVSLEEMAYCTSNTFGASCSYNAVGVRALGNAEFMDHDNWNRTNLGVGPYSGNYTFGEMLCHQQMYAKAALTVFVPASSNAQMPSTISITDTTSVVGQIYSWDYLASLGGGYTANENYYGNYPLHPGNYC